MDLWLPPKPAIIRPAEARALDRARQAMLQVTALSGFGAGARANVYTTWNPSDKAAGITLSNGNLTAAANTTAYDVVRAVKGLSSGKWYWEVHFDSGSFSAVGIATASASLSSNLGSDANGWGYNYSGTVLNNGSTLVTVSSYAIGDYVNVAFDADAGKLYFGKNGTWQNSAVPSSGTGAVATGLTSGPYYAAFSNGSSVACTDTANFGATTFNNTVPSGFNAGVFT
jgi:hypothetical protein